ncbi:MAG: thioredoxin family protein [Deltaproteobacteria bacterium]|nr:thioredoxin family protein [Deltaproteobacteria bacterium]
MRVLRSIMLAVSLVVVGVAAGCDKEEINKALGRYRAYDPKASGKAQIAAAVAAAKASNKRVLVQFGGNWCVFCEALDVLIAQTPALAAQHSRYVAIHVDAGNNPELDEVYGKPFALGFPVLLVLDGDGKLLHTQASTAFQLPNALGHDPAGVHDFLKTWAGP